MGTDPAAAEIALREAEIERLRAQLALRDQEIIRLNAIVTQAEEAQHRWHSILQAIPVAIWLAPIATGRLDYMNPACELLLGAAATELHDLPLVQVFADDPAQVSTFITSSSAQESWEGELHIHRSDGTTSLVHLTAMALRDAAGIPQATMGVMRDLNADQHQQEQLHLFQTLVACAPDGIALTRLDGQLIYTNEAFELMFGHSTTVIGASLESLVAPEDRSILPSVIAQVLTEGVARGQIRYLHADSTTFVGQYSALLVRDRAGQPIAFASINRNISAQLRAEATLQVSEIRNRALLEAIPDLMFVFATDGTIIDYKADQASDLALPPELFLQRRVTEVLPPPLAAQVMDHIAALQHSPQPRFMEYQIPLSDGFLSQKMPELDDSLFTEDNGVDTSPRFSVYPFNRTRFIEDCSAATENLLLAAHARGLG
ncbi:MAG: PAS domain S-box protein, partial [Oscillochloris sp.]|nr:PAS domain S-box protein [Oscillochloris sp.]